MRDQAAGTGRRDLSTCRDGAVEPVSALVLMVLEAEVPALHAADASAQAHLIRRGPDVRVALDHQVSPTQTSRTLLVNLTVAGRLVEIDVRIIEGKVLVFRPERPRSNRYVWPRLPWLSRERPWHACAPLICRQASRAEWFRPCTR